MVTLCMQAPIGTDKFTNQRQSEAIRGKYLMGCMQAPIGTDEEQ